LAFTYRGAYNDLTEANSAVPHPIDGDLVYTNSGSLFWVWNTNLPSPDWIVTSIISAPGPTGWTGASATGPTGVGPSGPTGIAGPTGPPPLNFRGTVANAGSLGRISFPKTGDITYVIDPGSYYVYDEFSMSWTATAFGYTGATGPAGSFNATADIITSGNLFVQNISATGTISSIGDITTQANMACVELFQTSDVRYKSEIETIADPLDKIRRMRGVYFQMNSRRRTGVIAQETEAVLPEVVYTDSTAERRKSVDYGNIVGILIEGIKALDERLAALEKKESTE
jgi:hypothetical protein